MKLTAPNARPWRLLAPLALATALGVAVSPFIPASRAADDVKDDKPEARVDERPDSKPDAKPDAKSDPKADAKPDAKPATQPATQPSIDVSPEVRTELDALRDAYKGLKSLRVAGTMLSDMDVAGAAQQNRAVFEGTFEAPNKFRHVLKEGDKSAPEATLVGSTGSQLFAYLPPRKQFVATDAPKDRVGNGKLGKPYGVLLEKQNPGLLLALSENAADELLEGNKAVKKVDDVKIGDTSYTALALTGEKGGEATVLIDPKTHLVRQIRYDMRAAIDPKNENETKKAELTIDYTDVQPGADVKPEQFAWSPPEGVKDVTQVASADDDEETSPATALEGQPAPDFTLEGLDGKKVTLADLKGKVVLLDFWATWCGPCRMSLPHLDKMYQAHKAEGMAAFAVNLREDKDEVQEFVDSSKLGIPVLLDKTATAANKYLVTGIPETVVVGKDGKVKKVVVGAGPPEILEHAVEEALKEK